MSRDESIGYVERLWETGQRHLAAGRYLAAIRWLEQAERGAFRRHDGRTLARIYLPLLEARRQVRYLAAEGTQWLCVPVRQATRHSLAGFLKSDAGTLILDVPQGRGGGMRRAVWIRQLVEMTARQTGRALETLIVVKHGEESRLASFGDATFAGGIAVEWTADAKKMIGESVQVAEGKGRVPLPRGQGEVGRGQAEAGQVRESLLIGWEALALLWQRRHPLGRVAGPWEEIAWLRLALQVDRACEPVSMRLMALAEQVERG